MNTVAKYDPPSALDRIDLDTQCALHSRFFHEINTREDILAFEEDILAMDNCVTECPYPLFHSFADGMYTREIHITGGDLVVGKIHRREYFVNVIKGALWVVSEFGSHIIEAPASFVAKAGVKHIVYTLVDTVWTDTHKTDATTIEAAEADIFVDSYAEFDRYTGIIDYHSMCDEIGLTADAEREMLDNMDDMISQPREPVERRDSDIEGQGMFVTESIDRGKSIGTARIGLCRTPLGRYANHSDTPNAEALLDGEIGYFIAIEDLEKGAEITVDYRNVRKSAARLDGRLLCQAS